ncbi:hypothetical protein EDB89DRAFT_2245833, partial [Lactarius sanguifluus]
MSKMLDYVSKHSPSEQEKRGDKRPDEARTILDSNRVIGVNAGGVLQLIHSSDREGKIIYAREMKTGLDSRWGLSKFLQAREYHKAAKSAYYAAGSASGKDRDDAYFAGQGSDQGSDTSSVPNSEEISDRNNVTGVALSLRRIYLSCKDAFPTPQTKEAWEVTVWHEACAKTGSN